MKVGSLLEAIRSLADEMKFQRRVAGKARNVCLRNYRIREENVHLMSEGQEQ